MSDISSIEDTLITAISNLNLFKRVDSLGRKAKPLTLIYPSVFVYFVSDRNTGSKPRPIFELTYEIVVITKNLQTEAKAAKDIYELIDSVRDAVNGKTLDINDIEPFECISREMSEYEDGTISYVMQFKTRQYLSLVS